jgi:hypothetical protein
MKEGLLAIPVHSDQRAFGLETNVIAKGTGFNHDAGLLAQAQHGGLSGPCAFSAGMGMINARASGDYAHPWVVLKIFFVTALSISKEYWTVMMIAAMIVMTVLLLMFTKKTKMTMIATAPSSAASSAAA